MTNINTTTTSVVTVPIQEFLEKLGIDAGEGELVSITLEKQAPLDQNFEGLVKLIIEGEKEVNV